MNRLIHTLVIAIFCLLPFHNELHAQLYGNEWIDWNHTNPYFKIGVGEAGIYRVDHNTLSQAMQSAGHNINLIDPADFQVFRNGKQEYIFVSGQANGQFNTNDFIEFYGRKNDGENDAELYAHPSLRPNKYYSNFNDTAAYFLTWNTDPSSTKNRLTEQANNLINPPPKEDYYMHKNIREFHGTWATGKAHIVDGFNLHESIFDIGEGYMSAAFNKTFVIHQINLEDVYSNGPVMADVHINLISAFAQVHHVRHSINTNNIIDTVFGSSNKGDYVILFKRQIPVSSLISGSNDYLFQSLGTGSSDRNSIGYIETYYPRGFNFGNKSQYEFQFPGTRFNNKYIEITNFDHQGQKPVLIDVNNRQRIEGVITGPLLRFNIPFDLSDTAKCILVSQNSINAVTELQVVNFTNYYDQANQGGYYIVSSKTLTEDANGNNWVEFYRDYRASADGGGFDARIVFVDELVDQFAYGIKHSSLSVKHFVNMITDQFNVPPTHLFIIGRAMEYPTFRKSSFYQKINLIPTFGQPGSDPLLVTQGNSLSPKIALGRLAARTGDEVKIYYDKVILHEQNQNDYSNQTIDNKLWTKNILHFGGGSSSFEQSLFRQFLGHYEAKIEDSLYGGNVYSLFKTSPNPIPFSQSKVIDSLISNGVSMMTFFGHSSVNSWDISIDDPKNYNNYGKYPIIISNGCFSGQIHTITRGNSDRFIFEPDKGAIGFLSTTNYGEVWSLHTYCTRLYDNIGLYNYDTDIGHSIMHTVRYVIDTLSPSPLLKMLAEQNTLHGDPAISVNSHPLPDYSIEPRFITFDPANPTVDLDSIHVDVTVHNLGKVTERNYQVNVQRVFPDGEIELKTQRVKSAKFNDVIRFTFYTEPVKGAGENLFEVEIDPVNQIDEISENNNFAFATLIINSNNAIPAVPYEFAIVGSQPVTLKAFTSNLNAVSREYWMEIDTTEKFNSPVKKSETIVQKGGVIEWDNPTNLLNNTVYYWRVSPSYSHPDSSKWQSSSFIYLNGSTPGWNQSHYFQFLKDGYNNLELPANRKFKFVDDVKELKVVNSVFNNRPIQDVAAYFINSSQVGYWSCIPRGLVIVVIDSSTGLPWNMEDYSFGQTFCPFNSQRQGFHIPTNNAASRKNIIDLLDYVPDNNYILVMSFQTPEYDQFKKDTAQYGTSILHKLAELGAQDLFNIDQLAGKPPFIFFVKKGHPSSASELVGINQSSYLDTTYSIIGSWNKGVLTSTDIGPSISWDSLSWSVDPLADPSMTDTNYVEVIGIDQTGTENILFTGIRKHDTILNTIDAGQYPYIKLNFYTRDEVERSSAQLTKLRVKYSPVGDACMIPNKLFSFKADTILKGDILELAVAIENIAKYDLDSLLVKAYVIKNDNSIQVVWQNRFRPLIAGDTVHVRFNLETTNLNGINTLIVEANPDFDQLEHILTNNKINIQFLVMDDILNPLLDVTFDGVHIINGDIVSARPEIMVTLLDENQFLALKDTSLMNVTIVYPDGSRRRVSFSDPNLEFIPAQDGDISEENSAVIFYKPDFTTDGVHSLIVNARDATGNESGAFDYKISFEIINEAMISNVFNYPNPFTSRTQFVFTLTGSELPTYLKIQIMTVSGKIVREIQLDELGPINIGTNLTEFAWDGTDQYGDALANGLYIYRVVANLNGVSLNEFDLGNLGQDVSKYFNSGFGKMYLVR